MYLVNNEGVDFFDQPRQQEHHRNVELLFVSTFSEAHCWLKRHISVSFEYMKKLKNFPLPSFEDISLLDFFAFLFALGYLQSVLTVANHISQWVHNGVLHKVDAPGVPALVIGLLLIGISWRKQKGKFSTLMVISLTIFATASIFWLSGLRTNFYY